MGSGMSMVGYKDMIEDMAHFLKYVSLEILFTNHEFATHFKPNK